MTEWKMLYKTEDGESILICPHCGDVFLHQYKTEIFDCDEDEIEGLHVITDRDADNKIIVKKDLKGNPSPRRDGLKIHFFCEMCSAKSALDIYQHKGQTFVKFYQKK